jgi:beta-galactosidase GanA
LFRDEKSAVASAIGVHVENGIYGEYLYWGFMPTVPTSVRYARAFTKWLKERYGSVENLKKV